MTREGAPINGVDAAMHVLAVEVDIRIPGARSLKEKRSALRPLLDGLRNRHLVAVAEVDHHDLRQRTIIGLAAVSSSPGHAEELIDRAERFIWSFPELEVLNTSRHWLESR